MYLQDINLVITVTADGLEPNDAKPSADTVLTANLEVFIISFIAFNSF